MSSSGEHCNLDALRSEKRSLIGYLRYLVERIDADVGVGNCESRELLEIEDSDEFLLRLLCPKYFLQLIQFIKADDKFPRCVKPTESGLMTAAISIGSAVGMRTPSGPLTWPTRLKWAWQLVRLDLQKEISEERHPDFGAVLDRMSVSSEVRLSLDYRKALLYWVGYQLRGKADTPTDFKTSFRDGRLYVLLLDAILPVDIGVQLDVGVLLDATPERRAEVIAEVAHLVGLGAFISPNDILFGYDRTNLIFLSQLLRSFPSIDTFTVLITRGVQNDFCGLYHKSPVHVGADESFRLFGTREVSSETSPPNALEDLVQWARLQPTSTFALIHIRDWHRLEDPEVASHFLKFGPHCVAHSTGSQFVGNLFKGDQGNLGEHRIGSDGQWENCDSSLGENEYVVNVTSGISDVCGTGLEQLLNNIKEKARGFLLRVGVVGVSTDFQVSNLLFDLQTRFQIKYLATCSALTAAKSRRAHFAALDNIERYLDATVFHSISDFSFWLGPNKSTVHSPCNTSRTAPHGLIFSGTYSRDSGLESPPNGSASLPRASSASNLDDSSLTSSTDTLPSMSTSTSGVSSMRPTVSSSSLSSLGKRSIHTPSTNMPPRALSVIDRMEFENKHLFNLEDLLIMDSLFRNSSRIVIVSQLAGGFSGALVLLAKSFDQDGHEQGPFVIKLGQIDSVAQERTNFERIEEVIGNHAPYVYASYEGVKRAGLKFAFASHSGDVSSTTTFKHTYCAADTSQDLIDSIINNVSSALTRFYSVARLRTWPLLESYDFDGRGWALAAGGSDDPSALVIRMSGLMMVDSEEIESAEEIDFGDETKYFNVLKLMQNLEPLRQWCASQQFLVSFVHGDLNFSNILIDGSANVWLIDFQYTTKAHWLKDLGKLENDAQMEISIASHEDFERAMKITKLFHRHSPYEDAEALEKDVQALLLELPQKLQCVCKTLLCIRKLIFQLNMGRETDAKAYHITMLRYALHSMCFHHLTHWTRKWALLNACSHAQHIVKGLDMTTPTEHVLLKP